MREKLFSLDWLLFLCFISLIVVGFSVQYSAAGGAIRPWALHQISIFLLSLPLLFFIALVNKEVIFKYTYPIFFITVGLLLIVKFLGVTKMGATRWINLFGLVLQPSELTKISIILALAKCLSSSRHKLSNLIVPITIAVIPIFLTLVQPSLGSAIMMMLIATSLFFIAGVKKKYFLWGVVVCITLIPIIWNVYLYDYQKSRILSFLHPEQDLFGTGYNLLQSKIAIGGGGVYGKGFLNGSQVQLGFLPEKHTDFVLTIFTEENGFIRTIILFSLYMYLVIKGLLIAHRSLTSFDRLISAGVATFFAVHVIINSGMVMGLLPVVGIPLPLLSYGGSFMLTCMISFGLLLNIDIGNKKIENFPTVRRE